VHVTYEGGGTFEEASREVPKMAGEYFEIGTPPAYGLYARNVRGLSVNNVRFEVQSTDLRPAVVLENVSDASVHALSMQANEKAEALRFTNTRDVLVSSCRLLTPAGSFLKIIGPGSERITMDGGDISKAAKPVVFSDGASQKAVKLKM
jgi:hypothetical protein